MTFQPKFYYRESDKKHGHTIPYNDGVRRPYTTAKIEVTFCNNLGYISTFVLGNVMYNNYYEKLDLIIDLLGRTPGITGVYFPSQSDILERSENF
jgi:hypothetical protein